MTRTAGYEAGLFATLAELEPGSWWFRSRNALIEETVRARYAGARAVLEIGTGTGYTLQALSRALPEARLVASELHAEGLEIARTRVPGAEFVQLDALAMPFRCEFDLITAFDVLEHIEDDAGALRGIARALRPGGGLLVTVPQHRWLWSEADTWARHARRYRRQELLARLDAAGFAVRRVTSFVSLALPLMAAARLRGRVRRAQFDPWVEFRLPAALDRLLERSAAIDRAVIRRGVSLPAGGSLLVAAELVSAPVKDAQEQHDEVHDRGADRDERVGQ